MTQEAFLTAFIEGIYATTERFIQISQFDKTITAIINAIDENHSNLYYVSSYGHSNFPIYSLDNDSEKYSVGDQVYINLPNGDYNSDYKYIIGKISKVDPKIGYKRKEDYLVNDSIVSLTNDIIYPNKQRRQTLIIEFNAYVNISDKIKEQYAPIYADESGFLFTIKGKQRFTNKKIEKNGIWTTRNLYGNIFNKNKFLIPTYHLVINNLEDLVDISITIDNKNSNIVALYNYQNGKIEKIENITGTVVLSNIKYYFGYDNTKIQNNSVNNVSILLAEDGIKLFYFDDDKQNWNLITDEDKLETLNEKIPNKEWEINWYQKNPLQQDYNGYNNPVPQYWDLMEETVSYYKDKLVLLYSNKTKSFLTNNSVYSILEKKE